MSSISEAISQRMTLGYLTERYGFDLVPPFAANVTITSLANDLDSVTPGSLYIPGATVAAGAVSQAAQRGAYAALLPHAMKSVLPEPEIPVLFAEPTAQQLGKLAADIAGAPSETLAIFAVVGTDRQTIGADVQMLAQFLHMLGNPVGVLNANDSSSLERFLDLEYPVDILTVQRVLSVCAEDGAAAVIIAMDDATLQPDALQSVAVDVVGCDGVTGPADGEALVDGTCERYGCPVDRNTHVVFRTEESDALAVQADVERDEIRPLSLAISCVLAAGVRKNSIRSALRVSRELH
ncbi:UDP-N-acetylmuramyl peptide synthase [Bifidobacterium choloepi]|uniref:UDP-N-acetylmuramyl peptide synthase n=1 Tax=Bifidobacterium choloepi TaxID=2614131 RepID=A0A6I5N1L5_9BIFI|nr:UDP-N-acetylmuramyl peptide synthase [Bifidobacterium choloepi]NEG70045.1 UDP-N-acetylmuramyl peptide synthase [Bifidobacterium choloepi]